VDRNLLYLFFIVFLFDGIQEGLLKYANRILDENNVRIWVEECVDSTFKILVLGEEKGFVGKFEFASNFCGIFFLILFFASLEFVGGPYAGFSCGMG